MYVSLYLLCGCPTVRIIIINMVMPVYAAVYGSVRQLQCAAVRQCATVRQCGSARHQCVCGSACVVVRQCAAVLQCVRGSARGCVRQCAQPCVAECGSVRVAVRASRRSRLSTISPNEVNCFGLLHKLVHSWSKFKMTVDMYFKFKMTAESWSTSRQMSIFFIFPKIS
jgi:hypothetical protein